MHEVSIAQSIISLVESSLPGGNDGKVSSVQVRVGELSSIEPDALQFSFDIVKAKTSLSNARLDLEIIEGRGICSDCDHAFALHSFATPCPQCNSYLIRITQGKEMKVVSFDLDD